MQEVLFGPMDWEKKWHIRPRNLIMSVIATMRSACFTSRKGLDDETAVLVRRHCWYWLNLVSAIHLPMHVLTPSFV
jgi:hypothetical protein